MRYFGSTNAPPPDHASHAGITLRPENASLACSPCVRFFRLREKYFAEKKNEIKNFYEINRMQCFFLKTLTF